jgi:hypothetical protein
MINKIYIRDYEISYLFKYNINHSNAMILIQKLVLFFYDGLWFSH